MKKEIKENKEEEPYEYFRFEYSMREIHPNRRREAFIEVESIDEEKGKLYATTSVKRKGQKEQRTLIDEELTWDEIQEKIEQIDKELEEEL